MHANPARRRLMRAVPAVALTIGAALAVPLVWAGTAAAASSATAEVNEYDWQLDYTAAPGQRNTATVTASITEDKSSLVYVIDDIVPITAGHNCAHPDSGDRTKVSCTVTVVENQDPYAALVMDLGGGNDKADYNNDTGQIYSYAQISLGTGDDEAVSTGSVDGAYISGDAGDDTISVGKYGMAWGNDGNDTITADGGDNIVKGGAGDDVLRGGSGAQDLAGDDGEDHVYGGTGDDTLYGGEDNDVMYGNSGDDRLYGGPGTDTLSGGPGNNEVHQD
ncbi:calcium-binding protein [Streptomyces tendae]|uniref:calcium-binding protein n=1 Tax=Streptomyces tendae TaxID=1932 RepID=UPI003789387F